MNAMRAIRKIVKISCFYVLGIGLASCRNEPLPVNDADALLPLSLTSGATVKTLIGDSSLSVVLVHNPVECLTCAGDLREWVQLAHASHGSLSVILTRNPEGTLLTLLTRLRIRHAVLSERDALRVRDTAPIIALFTGTSPRIFASHLDAVGRASVLDSARKLARVSDKAIAGQEVQLPTGSSR